MADSKARWVKRAAKVTGMESEDVEQIVTYLMSCEPGSIEELAISMLGDSDNVKRLARDMRDELRPKPASGGPTRYVKGGDDGGIKLSRAKPPPPPPAPAAPAPPPAAAAAPPKAGGKKSQKQRAQGEAKAKPEERLVNCVHCGCIQLVVAAPRASWGLCKSCGAVLSAPPRGEPGDDAASAPRPPPPAAASPPPARASAASARSRTGARSHRSRSSRRRRSTRPSRRAAR